MSSTPSITPAGNFFGVTDYTDVGQTSQAQGTAASALFGTGTGLTKLGGAGLEPVFTKLLALLNGNPGAVDQATEPQTASILRQYDTALATAERTAPRGGGEVSSIFKLEAGKASDLASTKSRAVTDATGQLGQLASATAGQGVAAEERAAADLGGLVQAALQGEKLSMEKWASIGSGIGNLLGSVISGGGWGALSNLFKIGSNG